MSKTDSQFAAFLEYIRAVCDILIANIKGRDQCPGSRPPNAFVSSGDIHFFREPSTTRENEKGVVLESILDAGCVPDLGDVVQRVEALKVYIQGVEKVL